MRFSVVLSAQPARFAAATFQGELAEHLAAIAAMGYDGAELAVRDPAEVDLPALREDLSRLELPVSAIGTGQAYGEDGLSLTAADEGLRLAAQDRLRAHLDLAAALDAVVILGLIRGSLAEGVEPGRADAWLVEGLRSVGRQAREAGVRLALEPINRYETSLIHTVAEGLALLDRVGEPALGLLLDTFHMNIEEPDPQAAIDAAGERIVHFHVADSNRHPPGGGHLDFGALLARLAATGYSGWVSGEFLPVPDALTAASQGLSHLRALRSDTR